MKKQILVPVLIILIVAGMLLCMSFGLFPEGVTYAILIMNALVWFIDRHTAPRRFGITKGGAAK